MHVLRRVAFAAALLLAAVASSAPLSYRAAGYVSLGEMRQKHLEAKKHGLDVPDAVSHAHLYRIQYQSTDPAGKPTTLSGLVMLPGKPTKGLVVYCHATTRDSELAPSRYTGTNNLIEPEYVMLAFASGGYAVVMPDYFGLGDSVGVQPYPGSEANAGSAVSAVQPAREIARRLGMPIGKPLYLAGYSQGGAVAMCAVRRLETGNTEKPTAAVPMSGPYDLSGETVKSILKGRLSLEGLGTRLFLLGLSAYSASHHLPGLDLKDYFAPSFATYVEYLFGRKQGDIALAKKLVIKALQLGALSSVSKILTAQFRKALEFGDTTNPLIADMRKGDCYDWAPKTKMLLAYLKGDSVVTEQNTVKAIDTMRLNGVGPNRLRPFPISGKGLSHTTAAATAFSAARRFFDGGFAGAFAVPSATAPK